MNWKIRRKNTNGDNGLKRFRNHKTNIGRKLKNKKQI